MWRGGVVALAATLALAWVTGAGAQPVPPSHFYGSVGTGNGAQLDGALAPDGAVVRAWVDGVIVGRSRIQDGTWGITLSVENTTVTFTIDGSSPSPAYTVAVGEFIAVALDLTSPAPETEDPVTVPEPAPEPVTEPVAPEAPAALPNTGSGGLADAGSRFPLLPVALAVSVLIALAGPALTGKVRAR